MSLDDVLGRPTLEAIACTDVGSVRPHNEDSIGIEPGQGILVVADGMGGYNAGEVASDVAVQTIVDVLRTRSADGIAPSAALNEAVAAANRSILATAARRPECLGMGTTAVAALLHGATLWHAHVGDSRLYLLRAGSLQRLTTDHTVDQSSFGDRAPPSSGSSGVLTRALGVDPIVAADIGSIRCLDGDLMMLCTDGLTDMVPDTQMAQLLRSDTQLPVLAERLMRAAIRAGGVDNIAFVLARVSYSHGTPSRVS